MNEKKIYKERGFVLFYTLVVVSTLIIVTAIFNNTSLKEINISRSEVDSLKAYYAADSAIECVRYYQRNYGVFSSSATNFTYQCGPVGSFQAGPMNSGECVSGERNFSLNNFNNNSLAEVRVFVEKNTVVMGDGSTMDICNARVISYGYNDKDRKNIERIRWEDM